jgi:hypothetical protein
MLAVTKSSSQSDSIIDRWIIDYQSLRLLSKYLTVWVRQHTIFIFVFHAFQAKAHRNPFQLSNSHYRNFWAIWYIQTCVYIGVPTIVNF